MGEADVAFDAIRLPCPQSMLLKPTQFPSLECSDFKFRILLPCGQVFLEKPYCHCRLIIPVGKPELSPECFPCPQVP